MTQKTPETPETPKRPDPRPQIWRDLIKTIDRDPLTAVIRLQTMIRRQTGDPEVMVNLSDLEDMKDQIRDMISRLETDNDSK